MNAEISENIKATKLGYSMQIFKVLAQRRFQQGTTPTLKTTNDYSAKNCLASTFLKILQKRILKLNLLINTYVNAENRTNHIVSFYSYD